MIPLNKGSGSLNLCMAPLRGVTVSVYRETYVKYFGGIDRAVAPFITTVSGRSRKASVSKEVDPERNSGLPLIPQILSKEPEGMRSMIRRLRDLGYREINLNLGCPHPMVRNRGRGSGLLENSDLLRRVLDASCDEMPEGFSVKVRLGVDDKHLLYGRAEMLNDYPLSEVMIHPRTAVQMYGGVVDLDAFEELLSLINHRVVYNGDLFSLSDVEAFRRRFSGVTHLMLGRGLVADPFLPERIRYGSASKDAVSRLWSFLDELLSGYESELFGPGPVLGRMKEMWGYLASLFEDGDIVLKRIQRMQSVDAYRRLVVSLREKYDTISADKITLSGVGT